MKIYNTLTKKKEEFKPVEKDEVGIYSCGPTVYNYVHIGNLRSYIFADLLHRVFEYNGYKVKHVMNITDVDDKTIRDSVAVGESLKDFTEKYTKAFFEDLEKLNINKDEYIFPRATKNIEGMIVLIKKLLDKGFAYKAEDGSIYFAISKFKNYGQLSGVDFERDSKARINNDEYAKDEAHDFALWKAWDEKDGDVFWDPKDFGSEFGEIGKGRPGWHIECSVMSTANLGQPFDIHTGGIDLIFPHHENEISQSEAANDKKFVNYWMHNEMLMVDGQKMSKSLGNVYTLESVEKGLGMREDDPGINGLNRFEPIDFRYLCLFTHYRQKMNFTWEALDSASRGLKKLKGEILLINELVKKGIGRKDVEIDKEYKNKFLEAINDDINTPKALAVLQELLSDNNVKNPEKLATIFDFDRVLGLGLDNLEEKEIPKEIIDLAEERKSAKAKKDFAKSDEIRAKIEEAGYIIEDLANNEYKLIKK